MTGSNGTIAAASADSAVTRVAAVLAEAERTGQPCPPVRTQLPAGDIATAYAVAQHNVDAALAAGRRLVGRKVGLTSPAVQRQLGVDQPDCGALLADMAVPDGGEVPSGRLLQPKIEAEVALVLGRDLPAGPYTVADLISACDYALPALEIVDSRVAGWDITIVDTVADNASSGLFVLGGRPVRLTDVDLREVTMTLRAGEEEVSRGCGTDCLGGPLNSAVWLASTLHELGIALRAGDIVLTGALGPMVPVTPGSAFETTISGLGSVQVSFAA
ncbi:2-keto-4-pentenoate hydratase [Parafrankia sp. EUN1f]|uniref:2-keto-4-pentenoate hydratase n=1 Tax=Parafrankia sp. EUN1f TaxID=102897 RepID=UPI0001C446BE|nr:fumarylacetoacetate hydrolase family protein [Parafrankia sp. EUN1f]EFC84443.1 2-oxopent-4-enoate hydratase [Parafrankia sp. EUN1f]